jgi:hypothetical protein
LCESPARRPNSLIVSSSFVPSMPSVNTLPQGQSEAHRGGILGLAFMTVAIYR